MKTSTKYVILLCFCIGIFGSCEKNQSRVTSPSANISVEFFLGKNGAPAYTVWHETKLVIDTSYIAFEFEDMKALNSDFTITNVSTVAFDEEWEMPWGEKRLVKNKYNQLIVSLQEKSSQARKMDIIFRVYDDGLGFRYHFPAQSVKEMRISDELTEFNLTGDFKTWWIPGDWDSYELIYNTTNFSEIDALSKTETGIIQSYIPENAVNTPVSMKTQEGLYLSFHEANLTDYSGMTLKVDTVELKMTSNLVGSRRTSYKVKRQLPFFTP
ncbi:MAG: glycoside hydrolase family 97 N-terminal domain-containing protein, partial [Bacteroidales bacterium]|nr:glycoside hydrolase family 97 N-terminal domain-containing protein [Bacteroidales bacterium]